MSAKRKRILAWHFCSTERVLRYDEPLPIEPGYVYGAVGGKLELCEWGMHASVRPLDALSQIDNGVHSPQACGECVPTLRAAADALDACAKALETSGWHATLCQSWFADDFVKEGGEVVPKRRACDCDIGAALSQLGARKPQERT